MASELMNTISLVLMLCVLTILLFPNSDPSHVFPGTPGTERGKGKDSINTWLLGKRPRVLLLL